MFAFVDDLGSNKTRLVARELEKIGCRTRVVERLLTPELRVQPDEPRVALFGVDNVIARRCADTLGFDLVVEAGLGSGYKDFRTIRLHSFPCPRPAGDVWKAAEASQVAIALPEVYQRMTESTGDQCGVAMLASRAVATPFVGCLAASLVIAEVLRAINGGPRFSTIDLSMRDLRWRSVVANTNSTMRNPGYVRTGARPHRR
jgi:hypothetical protein